MYLLCSLQHFQKLGFNDELLLRKFALRVSIWWTESLSPVLHICSCHVASLSPGALSVPLDTPAELENVQLSWGVFYSLDNSFHAW